MDKFKTIKEVAVYLRLSTQSVKRMIEDGRLSAHKIGRCSYRIPENSIRELLTQSMFPTQTGSLKPNQSTKEVE